ncbi:carbohydrate-binding cytochrome b562 [Colletotrichum fioriniae PJ7]|uniref:Carbohydrate-binding cytochrome b562 n=1 Tax=Colletotrichum fioriniae PJ7 TaxID=1445577 RepID=A0A010QC25_9PEZI|nr:carbohydrate-binding cytochrome b562 [Colletotrichum fioriniae PJ7]
MTSSFVATEVYMDEWVIALNHPPRESPSSSSELPRTTKASFEDKRANWPAEIMRWLTYTLSVVALISFVAIAQDQSTYCDSLGRCFASYTNAGGITYGIAIPEGPATGQPYEAIVQITSPIEVGWAALAWGGSMTYNPLTIVWANGKDVVVSSRMAL